MIATRKNIRRLDTLVLATIIVALIAGGLLLARESLAATQHCESRACMKRAIQWQRADRLRLQKRLAQRLRPDVELGYALAQGLYHVDLRKLGYCESRNDPYNRTGQYINITQQGVNFRARNSDVYSLVSIWNPLASILTAARWIAAHGSGEWQCRLDGSVKHGGAYS